jgi:DegV family protein with EDD domain
MPVAVVTDSTAYLPAECAHGVTVVPLYVRIGGVERREGVDVSPAEVAEALATRPASVSTSRPAPADFVEVYRALLREPGDRVVSVHLARQISGTYDAAVLAAAEFGGRVTVVDSGSTGMGLGFAVLAAASAAAAGGSAGEVAAAADAVRDRTVSLFYVDTLEFLRRGGRIGAASALLGSALSVKPILQIANGEIVVRDKVRTSGRALARLVDLAVDAVGESDVDVVVHHSAAAQRADSVLAALTERLGERVRDGRVIEAGGVITAHVGPGFVAVVLHARPDTTSAATPGADT